MHGTGPARGTGIIPRTAWTGTEIMDHEERIRRIREGYYAAFINGRQNSTSLAYKPELVSNDYQAGRKVLSTIEKELQHCREFCISVAFITMGGITPLLETLRELEQRGIPGRILTTDYLNFSAPGALEKLHSLRNLDVRMYLSGEDNGFHTKGYIFRDAEDDNLFRIIVGSSNLTQTALTQNKEWNTRLVSTRDGEYAESVRKEFEALWESERTRKYEDFIESYRTAFRISREQRAIARQAVEGSRTVSFTAYTLKPNTMQQAFITSLEQLRATGAGRALLVSATGTGKTYASAFAMREGRQKRVLFLVHREQIARQARTSYQQVFGGTRTFGLLSGNAKDTEADYIFATMQTMAKDSILHTFPPEAFETIIIDEVHKAGAASYQKIMEYFRPQLWLGMTATPERTDGYDIYQLFDHNIAYEIRLQQALEENLLCPFHYFGITDLELDGMTDDDAGSTAGRLQQFNALTSDVRVRYILEQAAYYGHSGSRVKGLMFVSRREIGEELSRKFNEKGLRTRFLSGSDSQERREYDIECLSTEDPEHEQLDYILTVDIFNEGLDVPDINQVILLRPTQSPIIFVQQLGRGLRKAYNKEYLVVLDFIGAYLTNYMIPIALSGDRSYNKDNMRRFVSDGARVIPGCSTIHFDAISRRRIYAAIDTAKVNDLRLIRENYQNLKAKLGRIPALMDFDRYGEMDVLHIFGKCGSYYQFLVKYDRDFRTRISAEEAKILEFVSCQLADGKRAGELQVLKKALQNPRNVLAGSEAFCRTTAAESRIICQSVARVLMNEFPSGAAKDKYAQCILLQRNASGDYDLSDAFLRLLAGDDFRRLLEEVIDFGLYRNERDYSRRYRGTDLVLYQKYTYEDVCRLLGWDHNEVPLNIGGYKYDGRTRTFPVFVNYVKDETVAATQQYEDRFTSPDQLTAISKSGRTLASEDVQNFLHCEERGIAVHLFVRKNKDDKVSKEFYYLGRMFPEESRGPEQFTLPGTDKTAVRMYWRLDRAVREDLYEYITEGQE